LIYENLRCCVQLRRWKRIARGCVVGFREERSIKSRRSEVIKIKEINKNNSLTVSATPIYKVIFLAVKI
jgi:hypothetical protein